MFIGNDLMFFSQENLRTFSRNGASRIVISQNEKEIYGDLKGLSLMKIWTVKEAAYKYFCKCGFHIPFCPADFHVVSDNEFDSGKVLYEGLCCDFETVTGEDYIHSVCFEKLSSYCYFIINKDENPQYIINEKLNLDYTEIVKDEFGIPHLKHNSGYDYDISKSGDNGFVSYALISGL